MVAVVPLNVNGGSHHFIVARTGCEAPPDPVSISTQHLHFSFSFFMDLQVDVAVGCCFLVQTPNLPDCIASDVIFD
jgi:hypothetical protein